jgi:prepilin-type N-terminal cleavage/methylation domain-containing protein
MLFYVSLKAIMRPRKRNKNNGGFTLVEVLIATVIMVISIVTVNAAFRQFAVYKEKIKNYENIYVSVLSIRDLVENQTLSPNLSRTGKINGLDYQYTCTLVESANNYLLSEEPSQNGNNGLFAIMLYKITITMAGKTFEIYKTEYKTRLETVPGGF